MPTGNAALPDTADYNFAVDKKSPVGDWEIHACGDGRLPGMAVVSAIATLQLGATLAEATEDKIAMNEAVEYLTKTFASQLKIFRETLAHTKVRR
jgi:hypothetical protein